MGKVKNLVELKKALDFGLSIDIVKKMYLNTDGKLFFTYDEFGSSVNFKGYKTQEYFSDLDI